MTKFSKGLLLLIFMANVFAQSEINDETVCDASSSLEVLRKDKIITIENFIKANKEITIDDSLNICSIVGTSGYKQSIDNDFDLLLEKNKINKSYFKERGYVNIKCYGKNILVLALYDDPVTFSRFLNYGLNPNRPLQYDNLVGTPLDFAKYEFDKAKAAGKNPAEWFTRMRILKEKGGKSCKELGLKCSIDS